MPRARKFETPSEIPDESAQEQGAVSPRPARGESRGHIMNLKDLKERKISDLIDLSKEFNIERYYRDAPLLCIGEGTNELQRIIIARQLVARNPV